MISLRQRVGKSLPHRPRLALATGAVILAWGALAAFSRLALSTRNILAFDVGAVLFLGLTAQMILSADPARVGRDARLLDAKAYVILAMTVGAAIFCLVAVGVELGAAKSLPPVRGAEHVALAGGSAILSWSLTHTMFALHYAHLYYGDRGGKPVGGLDIPGDEKPDYWDFLYFAFVMGMTCQTADIGITSRHMRRVALAHGMLAFLFNTVILALSINVAAGLL